MDLGTRDLGPLDARILRKLVEDFPHWNDLLEKRSVRDAYMGAFIADVCDYSSNLGNLLISISSSSSDPFYLRMFEEAFSRRLPAGVVFPLERVAFIEKKLSTSSLMERVHDYLYLRDYEVNRTSRIDPSRFFAYIDGQKAQEPRYVLN